MKKEFFKATFAAIALGAAGAASADNADLSMDVKARMTADDMAAHCDSADLRNGSRAGICISLTMGSLGGIAWEGMENVHRRLGGSGYTFAAMHTLFNNCVTPVVNEQEYIYESFAQFRNDRTEVIEGCIDALHTVLDTPNQVGVDYSVYINAQAVKEIEDSFAKWKLRDDLGQGMVVPSH